uniref:Protein kinase domain-containing protein n=1 Tax=Denticeps clupeoides TaxID=299321 RepID=A0AAY4BRP3_9TELE
MFFKKKTRNQECKVVTETKLNEGSSGLVFKAVKNLTGQMAAVKVIDVKEKTPKKEVEFMQNTKHRNITKLLEIYLWKDQLYICMEHCNGGTLWDLCYETGSLTELEIAYVTKQCLQALHYMHGRGYMHRDIKLENIFLTFTGEVKIGDFGAIDRMENLPHEVAGTAETRAPEVSKVGERGSYDEKCDIWSLGISLLDLAECMSLVTYKPDEVYQSWTTIAKNHFMCNVQPGLFTLRRRLNAEMLHSPSVFQDGSCFTQLKCSCLKFLLGPRGDLPLGDIGQTQR